MHALIIPYWVYELVVGKQPTVGAGLPRPAPIYRRVSPFWVVAMLNML